VDAIKKRSSFVKNIIAKNPKEWIAFIILLLAFVACFFVSLRSVFAKEQVMESVLIAYDCGKYKSTSIHNHVVTLENGLRFQMASSNLPCDKVEKPAIGDGVRVITKRNKLLSLSQGGEEILKYSLLKEDSDKSTATMFMVTVIIFVSLLWSGLKIFHNRSAN
jgi:hypothetical protein